MNIDTRFVRIVTLTLHTVKQGQPIRRWALILTLKWRGDTVAVMECSRERALERSST